MVYADVEALVIPTGQEHTTRMHRSFDNESETPCSLGYYIVSIFPQFNKGYKSEMGGCIYWFMEEMQNFAQEAMRFYYDEERLQGATWRAFNYNRRPTATYGKNPSTPTTLTRSGIMNK